MKKQTNNTSKNKAKAPDQLDEIINTLVDALIARDNKKAYLPLWYQAAGVFCDYYNQREGVVFCTDYYLNVESASQFAELELPFDPSRDVVEITAESFAKRIDYILCALLFYVHDGDNMNATHAANHRELVLEAAWEFNMAWHLKEQIESQLKAA